MKRVLLFVIDALTGPLLAKEIDNGRYPNFKRLQEAGVWHKQCVSIFPSITHAALTSIVTGHYPVQHGVVATHWYDVAEEKVAYFSSSLEMVLQKGLGEFFRDFLLALNNVHLKSPTIFQQLERDGFETACVNFPIYRGDVEHEVNMPLLLKWIPGLPGRTTIKGPKKLLLGDLLANPDDLDVEAAFTGISHWFGFRDENTIDLILQMAEADEFPDFTLSYYPENDYHSHEEGPEEAHTRLSDFDEMLGRLFEMYGGLDAFLQQFAVIITGDHSHSETIEDEAEEGIDLETVLTGYQLAEAGKPWQDGDEIMPCPNLRAAHLYFKTAASATAIEDVIDRLLSDQRVDQVIYRADLMSEDQGYLVQTSNGRLHFWQQANGMAEDQYGNSWAWDGDLAVVNGRLQDNVLSFPDYPNAFERIAGVLDAPNSGQIWLTAKIGHEVMVPHIKTYADGGSHASLHRADSQPPLLLAGLPQHVNVPEFPRIIDIAPLCRDCLAER